MGPWSQKQLAVAAAGLGLAATVLVALYHNFPNLQDTLEYGAAVVGGAGALFGLFYGFHRASVVAADSRRRRSLDIIDQLNRRDVVKVRVSLARGIEGASDGYQYIVTDDQRYADAVFYLGLLEDIALTIRTGVADEQVLYDSLSYMIPANYRTFLPFIEGMRKEDPTLFEEVAKLTSAWNQGKSLCADRPLKALVQSASAPPLPPNDTPSA